LVARSRSKARRANEFALFPTQLPRLGEASPIVGRRLAECQRWVVRRFEESSPSCTAPATLPHAFGPSRSRQPPIASKRGSAPALSLGAAARSRWSVGLG